MSIYCHNQGSKRSSSTVTNTGPGQTATATPKSDAMHSFLKVMYHFVMVNILYVHIKLLPKCNKLFKTVLQT